MENISSSNENITEVTQNTKETDPLYLEYKNHINFITEKSTYMNVRRNLTDKFILFFLISFKSKLENYQENQEDNEEWLESIVNLKKKFSSKMEVYGINYDLAEDSLISALIDNYKHEEKYNNTNLPLFALAHPHIPEIEIAKSITSISSLYKSIETNYNFYLNDFEKEKKLTLEKAQNIINSFPVVIFIKGTPINPFCKFSKSFMEVIKKNKFNYRCFNIFEDDKIRGYMKFLHGFKTFPQIFINSKLIGGLDIITELDQKGEFIKLIPQECTFEAIIGKVEKLLLENQAILFVKVNLLFYIFLYKIFTF
jgi:glutaredoxin-related protein